MEDNLNEENDSVIYFLLNKTIFRKVQMSVHLATIIII